MKKKKLSELLEEGRFELFKHNKELLVAPLGCGKTYLLMNKCKDFKNVLYLTDTNALQKQVENDLKEHNLTNVTNMTYQALCNKTIYDTEDYFINTFDLIVCDEVHNLVAYSYYNSGDLKYIIRMLFSENTYKGQLLMMTATPTYVEKLTERNPNLNNFKTIDLMDEPDLFRLTELEQKVIKHYSEIRNIIKRINDNKEFEYGNKLLIYTNSIETMKKINEFCIDLHISSTLIFSPNNKKHKMTKEQLEERNKILTQGVTNVSVLIINNSMETGINLKDINNFQYVICNTSNVVSIQQSRGRVRNDIQCLYTRINDDEPLYFVEDYIDVELTKEEFMDLFKDFTDEKGKSWGIRKIRTELENTGYRIINERKRLNKKQVQVYTIMKK